jgi:hypothetical protein
MFAVTESEVPLGTTGLPSAPHMSTRQRPESEPSREVCQSESLSRLFLSRPYPQIPNPDARCPSPDARIPNPESPPPPSAGARAAPAAVAT